MKKILFQKNTNLMSCPSHAFFKSEAKVSLPFDLIWN